MGTVARSLRIIAGIAAALAIALQPAMVLASSDTANCSEYGYVHRAIGYQSALWSGHRYGVRVTFPNEGLHLCTNPRPGEGSTSVVWVAIQGPPSPNDIVQVGYGKCYPSGMDNCNSQTADHEWYAFGYDNCGGVGLAPKAHWQTSVPNGGVYTVMEDSSHGFWVETPQFALYLGPANNICWTNDSVSVAAESFDYGDALGGPQVYPVVVGQEQFRTSPTGAWMTLPSQCNFSSKDGGTLESIFHCYVNGSSINLYTAR